MSDPKEQRMQEEIAELWWATFGEQPAIEAEAAIMIRVLVACLKDPGPFELSAPPPRGAEPAGSHREAPGLPRLVEPAELGV